MSSPELVDGISGADIAAYLSRSWLESGTDPRGQRIFHFGEVRGQQVVIAIADTSSAHEIEQALRAVAFAENRALIEVADDLRGGGSDTIAARLLPALPSGETSLLLLESASSALHKLLSGALTDEDGSGPSRLDSDQWIDSIRVRASEGSFILNLFCPLHTAADASAAGKRGDDVVEPALFSVDQAPSTFGRRITARLHDIVARAVAGADEAVQVGPDAELELERYIGPANVTVLEGLGMLGGESRVSYELRFAWSRLPRSNPADELIAVSSAAQRVLRTYAESLRAPRDSSVEVTLSGAVVQLRRERAFGPGDVVVEGVLSDDVAAGERKVAMELDEDSYRQAHAAHGDGQRVSVRGRVVRAGNRTRLRQVKAFTIQPDMFDQQD